MFFKGFAGFWRIIVNANTAHWHTICAYIQVPNNCSFYFQEEEMHTGNLQRWVNTGGGKQSKEWITWRVYQHIYAKLISEMLRPHARGALLCKRTVLKILASYLISLNKTLWKCFPEPRIIWKNVTQFKTTKYFKLSTE